MAEYFTGSPTMQERVQREKRYLFIAFFWIVCFLLFYEYHLILIRCSRCHIFTSALLNVKVLNQLNFLNSIRCRIPCVATFSRWPSKATTETHKSWLQFFSSLAHLQHNHRTWFFVIGSLEKKVVTNLNTKYLCMDQICDIDNRQPNILFTASFDMCEIGFSIFIFERNCFFSARTCSCTNSPFSLFRFNFIFINSKCKMIFGLYIA